MYDVLIIGGGVSGISCALILGSAHDKPFAANKKTGIITHQKSSSLNDALVNNAYGITPGKLGSELLSESTERLAKEYPSVVQIPNEKVTKIEGKYPDFLVTTNKNSYKTKIIVVAVGSANTFAIEGLTQYVEPHKRTPPEKQQIKLKNVDHKVAEGIYVIGTLAGLRSQVVIAAGSGAIVATDILTEWNGDVPTHIHDSPKK